MAIEAVIAPNASAAGRIVIHDGLTIEDEPFGTRATAQSASCFYFAFYPQSLLASRCEPYDQPSHAAYLPLPFSELEVMPLAGYGALLVQRERSSRADEQSLNADGVVSFLWTVADERELKAVLCEIAELAGVPRTAAMSALLTPVNLLSSPAA